MFKWIDLPPLWLLLFLFLAFTMPRGPELFYEQALMGQCFVAVGVIFMIVAVYQMQRHKTTVIPHRTASTLVTTGIFSQTRNPIYLGDTFVLAGGLFYWQAHLPALILVPAFMWVITQRFIKPEEERLLAAFGDAFKTYCDTTRRWL
ncbi:MAG: isoprenylcysteine carboxylmethyltransferase family protein [Pseudomonadota bacterium]